MKAAVIGCGRMGAEPSARLIGQIPSNWLPLTHVEALAQIPEIKLTALCDANETLLMKRGKHYNIDCLYTDYKRLISETKPDIITIATRTPIKCEIIEYACQNGVKGIYVEKPLANSIINLQRCFQALKQHKVKFLYGVNRRYNTVYRQAKDILLQGDIGDLIEINVEHGQSQLLWTHPHSVDLILFYANNINIATIQAELDIENSGLIVDSDPVIQHAFMKFHTGHTAHIGRSGGYNIRINGSKGTITIHADGAFIQINRSIKNSPYFLEQKNIQIFHEQSATITAIKELVTAINNNQPLPITLDEIEVGTKMLLGCVWSALNNGQKITLETVPVELKVTGKYNGMYA